MAASKTFTLKSDLKYVPMQERNYVDFGTYLYQRNPIKQNQGQILVHTNPEENGGHVISPGICNGFVGAMYRAYNEHRHLILRPDDVWLAITTAFGLFINAGNNAEDMRKHFVDFKGKIKLVVCGSGTLYTANWSNLINQMSDLIEKNTKSDTRTWIEPNFTTTSPVCKTVGQVVLMGVMKNYFDYECCFACGLPKVTLEGSLEDWQKLRQKAAHFLSFNIDCLTHWAGLLDFVLAKFVDSYEGKVDEDFWSHIVAKERWGSGGNFKIEGWVNVFMAFCEKGIYKLYNANPEKSEWGQIADYDIPPSTVELPVKINDHGRKYDTIFYGGHIVCLYNEEDNSVRPSLDWAIVDITGSSGPSVQHYGQEVDQRVQQYQPDALPKPLKYSYGA